MAEKPVVIVISDLHLGGGALDPGDDHVYDKDQLRNFILDDLLSSPEGRRGEIELFINGDFLEFAQVRQSAYTLRSSAAWCSEPESVAKLEYILKGHADVFAALRKLGEAGNTVTLAAGNHDVDLFWPAVQEELRSFAGNLQFVLGADWCARFEGRLRIAHGHQHDRGNRFERWSAPFVDGPDDQRRLEMCPGTLFMVKYVNWLEEDYPFADNIKPVGALWQILWRERKLGFAAAAWMLTRFAVNHPATTLGTTGAEAQDFPSLLVDAMRADEHVGGAVRGWYRQYVDAQAGDGTIERRLQDPAQLGRLLFEVIAQADPAAWQPVLDAVHLGRGTLGWSDGTLELWESQRSNDKELFRKVAEAELAMPGAEIVVLGHTHCPDWLVTEGGKKYFNPGSWTRYVEIGAHDSLRLADLRDESRFPYQLNFVRVARNGMGLSAEMHPYAKT